MRSKSEQLRLVEVLIRTNSAIQHLTQLLKVSPVSPLAPGGPEAPEIKMEFVSEERSADITAKKPAGRGNHDME